MKTKHKHYECIHAWADGEVIECYDISSGTWKHQPDPLFLKDREYRVRRREEIRLYTEDLGASGNLICVWRPRYESNPEKSMVFVKWITDMFEVDI